MFKYKNKRVDLLKEVKSELIRCTKKVNLAIKEQSDSSWMSHNRNYASAKRSALDLKMELTKLTQDTNYLYGKE